MIPGPKINMTHKKLLLATTRNKKTKLLQKRSRDIQIDLPKWIKLRNFDPSNKNKPYLEGKWLLFYESELQKWVATPISEIKTSPKNYFHFYMININKNRQPIRVYPYSTPNYKSNSNWFKIGATYWLAEGAPRFEERTR